MRSLDKFQNNDGTIAGFVNMGPKDEQCWRLGDLWGKYKPDVANLDFDSFVFHLVIMDCLKIASPWRMYFVEPNLVLKCCLLG